MTLTLPVRDELHQWARAEGVSAESEELAEVCARNIICGTIYDGDIARNRQLASAQSLLPPPNTHTQLLWNFVRAARLAIRAHDCRLQEDDR